jgi:hypothetical protein
MCYVWVTIFVDTRADISPLLQGRVRDCKPTVNPLIMTSPEQIRSMFQVAISMVSGDRTGWALSSDLEMSGSGTGSFDGVLLRIAHKEHKDKASTANSYVWYRSPREKNIHSGVTTPDKVVFCHTCRVRKARNEGQKNERPRAHIPRIGQCATSRTRIEEPGPPSPPA